MGGTGPGPNFPTTGVGLLAQLYRNLKAGLHNNGFERASSGWQDNTQQQLIRHLIDQKGIDSRRILRVQFDELPSLKGLADPIMAVTRWFQSRVLNSSFNEAAKAGGFLPFFSWMKCRIFQNGPLAQLEAEL